MTVDPINTPASLIPMSLHRYMGPRGSEFKFLYRLSSTNPPSLAVLRLIIPFLSCNRVIVWNRDIELHYEPSRKECFVLAKSLLTNCGCIFSYFCDDADFCFISIDSVSFFKCLISLAYVGCSVEDSRFRR